MSAALTKPVYFRMLLTTLASATLAACGGGGGGSTGNANGLLDEAQGCAYLVGEPFNIPAAQLNESGCIYNDANGNVATWAGTNGELDPDIEMDIDNDVVTTSEIDTDTGTPTDEESTVVFTEAQPFPSELLDNGTGDVYSQAVNSDLLSGAVVGTGEQLNANLYKSIPFTAVNIPPDFEILNALAHHSGRSDDSTHMIMHIRNNSNEVRCFVEHGEISAYDSNGGVISAGLLDFGFVSGSLGVATSSGTYTTTCIGPGEIVYRVEVFSENFTLDKIAAVKISDIESGFTSNAAEVALVPISYEVTSDELHVLVVNQSSQTLELDYSDLIILTDEGVPIYADLETHFIEMLPGEETVISYPNRFEGTSTNIRIVLDYQPAE